LEILGEVNGSCLAVFVCQLISNLCLCFMAIPLTVRVEGIDVLTADDSMLARSVVKSFLAAHTTKGVC
jgi:hypothetical protein